MMLALRAVFFTVLLPGTTLVWIPWMIVTRGAARLELGVFRWVGIPLIAVGTGVMLVCIVDFARKGRGTLAPIDPPRNLVASGLYRYVRNPMYVGGLLVLCGEVIFFQSTNLLAYALCWWLAVHLFIVLYEEPHLTSVFGDQYEEYRRAVPRWIPRVA